MKKIVIPKRNVYDVCGVMSSILRDESSKLDFKEVLYIQKSINHILDSIKDYSDVLDKLNKEKNTFVENANKKIAEFRAKVTKSSQKKEELSKEDKKEVEDFANLILQDVRNDIEDVLEPKYKELYEGIGKEEVTLEIEDDKHKMFLSNFEKYAKERYIDKSSMVQTYECLTV